MKTRNIAEKALFATLGALLLACASAAEPQAGIPKGTVVRIEGKGIESGWHDGRISVTSEGCTMVTLAKPTKDGYTMIALVAMARLQKQVGNTWQDIALKELLSREPKACLEGSD